MNVYNWINNFRNELNGKPINSMVFCMLLANKFSGDILVSVDEFYFLDVVVSIDGLFYDINGEVNMEYINKSFYIPLNKLSVLHNTSAHEQIKRCFID